MTVIQVSMKEKLEAYEQGKTMSKEKDIWGKISEKLKKTTSNSFCRKLLVVGRCQSLKKASFLGERFSTPAL